MKKTIQIDGMSCQHCVHAVRSALETVDGVSVHAVEIGSATIEIGADEDHLSRVREAIAEEGFVVVEA